MTTTNVKMLELSIEANGQRITFHPTLIWDDDMAILIDAGMPGQEEQIRSMMAQGGISFDRLKAVILTHQDLDHIGSLPAILREADGAIEVYAHQLDKPYIEGDLPLFKTDPNRMSKEAFDALPEGMRMLYANPPKAKVNRTLEDGQELPFCGGIQVIFTPGHTPGHISLYLKQSKTLVAGDAMICANGVLRGPVQQTTPDMDAALQSLRKFADYDIETVICYHGGAYRDGANQRIAELVNTLQ